MWVKIGLTGLPGVGKTTVIEKVLDIVGDRHRVVGFITEAVRDDGRITGFNIHNLKTGDISEMANENIESSVKIGRFGVNLSVLEDVCRSILEDLDDATLVVIDEVGKIESTNQFFVDTVKEVLDMEISMLMTLHKKSRNPLLQEIRRREDIRILEVTPINRSILPFKIVSMLEGDFV